MLIDSHCHLDYDQIFNNLDQVIKRAEEQNIKNFLTICTTVKSFDRIKYIVEKYKNIYGSFGIHPHETKDFPNIDSEDIVKFYSTSKKIVGIGETGLDFYYNHSDKIVQKKCFIEHIKASSELNIPLIVHTRSAEKETYDILNIEKKNCKLKVLIHCFTGSKEFAKRLLDIDCFISVSGIITFKKTDTLLNTLSFIPINRLLIETDSPYLAPMPFRGKPNEPSYLIHTAKKVSLVKNIPLREVELNTTRNFKNLFKIK